MTADAVVAIWGALVESIGGPAAILDRDGHPLYQNRAISESQFQSDDWEIHSIDDDGNYRLATKRQPSEAEQNDLRDFVLQQFFSTDGLMFVVIDDDGTIVETNDALTAALGMPRTDIIGQPFDELVIGFDDADAVELGESLERSGAIDTVAQMTTSSGAVRHLQWSIRRDRARALHFGVGRDITEERRMTAELRNLAYTDTLTGLANRAKLVQLLEEYLDEGHRPAVLFCDLDRFKIVNDSLGHAAGDELLRLLGRRLEALGAPTDVTSARLGGDEFVVMVKEASLERAQTLAGEIRDAVTKGFVIDGRPVKIGVTIGVALARAGHDAAQLLGEADTAAYEGKERGQGAVVVHDRVLQRRLDRRFEVEAGLASALADNRFVVHYQPIVQLPGSGVIGVEALVRWRDEDGALRRPAEFLDIAQDAGLLDEIGDRVLEQATTDLGLLRAGGRDLRLSVNATAGQISDSDFPDRVARALESSGMPPDRVIVEVTESAVVDDQSNSVPIMRSLRATGVRVAIDDFGTGYSSLSYLQKLPIDIVKIDRSFVRRIDTDDVALSVVRSVMDLCGALGLETIVEGIETKDQAAIIERLGCTRVQGYLFHEPLSIDQLTQRLTGGLPLRQQTPR